MRLNWVAYSFDKFDGYGRYGMHMIRALTRLGVGVTPLIIPQLSLPGWLQRLQDVDYGGVTVTCVPPYMLRSIPGRQWALTMTEGTRLPPGWAERINATCERAIVPCEHNQEAFEASGTERPVHVVPGGTCPQEFPVCYGEPGRAYTFLALADRGARKGWVEVWQAFYQAFGGPDKTADVRLIIKTRPHTNDLVDRIAGAAQRDPRIGFWLSDVESMSDLYAQVDCFAIPSRSEGWGMPHREAAMMGIPVIATRYSGLVDGIDDWATVVLERFTAERIPQAYAEHVRGDWVRPDVGELAEAMHWCYAHPAEAKDRALQGAQWLRENQTWEHAARKLLALIERYG